MTLPQSLPRQLNRLSRQDEWPSGVQRPQPAKERKQRRNRIVSSCEACRKRKIKCDRKLPFRACKDRKTTCEWAKGHPSEIDKTDPSTEIYVLRRLVLAFASQLDVDSDYLQALAGTIVASSASPTTSGTAAGPGDFSNLERGPSEPTGTTGPRENERDGRN